MKLRSIYKKHKGCSVATERSRVTKRTIRMFEHNLQKKTVFTKVFGSLNLEASVRDFRTINKHGSLEAFLIKVKTNNLSDDILKLKNRLLSKICEALEITNLTSALSHANKGEYKNKMLKYIESLYCDLLV